LNLMREMRGRIISVMRRLPEWTNALFPRFQTGETRSLCYR